MTALANVTVPYGTPAKVKSTLTQLIAGAKKALDEEQVALIGGHTTEGAVLSIGFAVNGLGEAQSLTNKQGLRPDDVLILTKPLGTGTLLAADMQHQCRGEWLEGALHTMQQSNRAAARVLRNFKVSACTDITGFGLAGHLLEMLRAENCSAVVKLEALPLLKGALITCNDLGIKSTLHEGNQQSCPEVTITRYERQPLVFDPQTSGGLLAGVGAEEAEEVVADLVEAGYKEAAVIGRVSSTGQPHIFFE